MGEGGGGEERKFLSFTSLPFSLPFFPFSPETPDTQASIPRISLPRLLGHFYHKFAKPVIQSYCIHFFNAGGKLCDLV